MKIFLHLIFLISMYTGNCFATACELLINAPNYFQSTLNAIKFSAFDLNYVWLDSSMGDKTASFNTNMNYEVVTNNGSYYFRLNGIAYNPSGTNQTYIYDVEWAFNMVPMTPGIYTVNAYNSTQSPIFYRYIDIIGDSMTWWSNGRFLRCLMRNNGLHYDFNGTQTDVFGFNHDGKGGDGTADVLARISSIPVSDAYFVLVGTNDHGTAQDTVNNIVSIAQSLHDKNPCAKIYVSTLLPRNDSYNSLNQSINNLLKNYGSICTGCILIDTGAFFYGLNNWSSYLMPDGIHPNKAGYEKIASYLSPLLL